MEMNEGMIRTKKTNEKKIREKNENGEEKEKK